MSGRLEFRVFGSDLARQRTILTKQFSLRSSETRSDLYFVGPRDSLSFKLRDGAVLDLKELVGHKGKYEHWKPRGKCNLPAMGKVIEAAFQDNSALPDLRGDLEYQIRDLTAAFARTGLRPVLVQKSRNHFSAGACLAELTHLVTETTSNYWTICIEGAKPADLDLLGSKLGLTGFDNQSFPAWIAAQASTTPSVK